MYTQEEINLILERFMDNITFTTAFLTACYTGMRTGEVFALTWNNIDFDKRIIKISKTVYAKLKNKNERCFLGTTKTEGSKIIVYICESLYKILTNYRCIQNDKKRLFGKKCKKILFKRDKE